MGVFWSTKSALFFMPGLGFVGSEDCVVDVGISNVGVIARCGDANDEMAVGCVSGNVEDCVCQVVLVVVQDEADVG